MILLTIGCKEKIELNNNYCPVPGASQSKKPVRLIDAEDAMFFIELEAGFSSGTYTYAEIKKAIDSAPTIDPESLRPTAHIIRGTVPDTHDDAFCSNCRSYLGVPGADYEDYDSVLNHRYKYCPYCSARIVRADE